MADRENRPNVIYDFGSVDVLDRLGEALDQVLNVSESTVHPARTNVLQQFFESAGYTGYVKRTIAANSKVYAYKKEQTAGVELSCTRAESTSKDDNASGEQCPNPSMVENEEREDCPICLSELEEGVQIRQLDCAHIFHADCVDRWLIQTKNCPYCRGHLGRKPSI